MSHTYNTPGPPVSLLFDAVLGPFFTISKLIVPKDTSTQFREFTYWCEANYAYATPPTPTDVLRVLSSRKPKDPTLFCSYQQINICG